MLKRSISKFEKFYFKNEIIYFDNFAIIRVREKRQTILQNLNTAKYEKIKMNFFFNYSLSVCNLYRL